MSNWDTRFLELAQLISTWSKYRKKQVGAVIVDPENRVISCGYNGYPKGVDDEIECPNLDKVIHAEINAILYAKVNLAGTRVYVYPYLPCNNCAKLIIQSGVKEVITVHDRLSEKWKHKVTVDLFKQAHIEVRYARISSRY